MKREKAGEYFCPECKRKLKSVWTIIDDEGFWEYYCKTKKCYLKDSGYYVNIDGELVCFN